MPASAQTKTAARRLSEEQQIAHVLNRFAFGARPGDIERVHQIGLDHWFEQQLHPDKIDDAAAGAKLAPLTTLTMRNDELFAKFPQPGQLVRQLQRQGKLPADLQALAQERKQGNAQNNTTDASGAKNATDATANATANAQTAQATPNAAGLPNDAAVDPNRREYREAIRDYMLEHGLQPPQRITAELQAARILRAVYSERQLQEVMVDFWTNHFNVFAGKGADRWLLVSYDRDTIRPNTFGKFSDLLVATAESPAMLFYLDNFQSVSPNAPQGGDGRGLRQLLGNNPRAQARLEQMRQQARPQQQQQRAKRGINENYARELMELHTLGVDGGYTQRDVQEVARCFTGWTIIAPRGGAGLMTGAMAEREGSFYFNPRQHDNGEKLVLGHKIPAGGGMSDGLMVLDILAHHPSTAKFIATKLCRKFVMDEPTPALVNRVAAAFTKSDGDIRETLKAIFTSPEFNAPENFRAKIKTPFELAVSAIRALGGDTTGGPQLHQWIARMGEPLYQYQPPTGYPDTAEHWVNTGALLERINFALALAANRIPGTRVDLTKFVGASATPGSKIDQARVLDQFVAVILQGDMSQQTKASLLKRLNEAATAPPPDTATMPKTGPAATQAADDAALLDAGGQNQRARRLMAQFGQLATNNAPPVNAEVARIAALILGSPEFQRQ
ncbi:MAG: hypothetical protein DMF64_13695 [Acidobacteria bacterium]|nr:MAG: hypothetical protein DMF64_13695 [Acidobacteriota bacterium]